MVRVFGEKRVGLRPYDVQVASLPVWRMSAQAACVSNVCRQKDAVSPAA
jgi:hypothetical protein